MKLREIKFVFVLLIFYLRRVTCSGKCTTTEMCIVEKGLTRSEEETILRAHNTIRKRICNGDVPDQPQGYDLLELFWDKNLAKLAQGRANTCKFEYNPVKDYRWSYVGQNLFRRRFNRFTSRLNVTWGVYFWYESQRKNFKFPKFSKDTGNYIQIVNSFTRYVGCGYTQCVTNKNTKIYHKILICNYGPGYYYGYRPYAPWYPLHPRKKCPYYENEHFKYYDLTRT